MEKISPHKSHEFPALSDVTPPRKRSWLLAMVALLNLLAAAMLAFWAPLGRWCQPPNGRKKHWEFNIAMENGHRNSGFSHEKW